MITDIEKVKEVEIVSKKTVKHYLLFGYDKNNTDIRYKYFPIFSTVDIEEINRHIKDSKLTPPTDYKIFSIELPI
jgi:hypothetical protein